MSDIYSEAEILACSLGYQRFKTDNEFLSVIVDALLRAEKDWKPDGGRGLNSWRYQYAKNAARRWNRDRTQVKKNMFHTQMVSLSKKIRVGRRVVSLKDTVVQSVKEFDFDEEKLIKLFKTANISTRDKDIIRMYYLDGCTFAEISEKYDGVSKQSISNWLKAALNELRMIIKEEDVGITSRPYVNPRQKIKLLTYKGKTQSMTKWAKEKKISVNTIQNRLKLNWTIEETLTRKPHA